MEFHITLASPMQDLDAIETAICSFDPSAVVDIDASGQLLRVAAALDQDQLIVLMGQAGFQVGRQQIHQVPSICCGGCSG